MEYDLYKSRGYNNYNYEKYNEGGNYTGRSNKPKSYRPPYGLRSEIKFSDKYTHHSIRNHIRNVLVSIKNYKYIGLEHIPKIQKNPWNHSKGYRKYYLRNVFILFG